MYGPKEAPPRLGNAHSTVASAHCVLVSVEHSDYWRLVQVNP